MNPCVSIVFLAPGSNRLERSVEMCRTCVGNVKKPRAYLIWIDLLHRVHRVIFFFNP